MDILKTEVVRETVNILVIYDNYDLGLKVKQKLEQLGFSVTLIEVGRPILEGSFYKTIFLVGFKNKNFEPFLEYSRPLVYIPKIYFINKVFDIFEQKNKKFFACLKKINKKAVFYTEFFLCDHDPFLDFIFEDIEIKVFKDPEVKIPIVLDSDVVNKVVKTTVQPFFETQKVLRGNLVDSTLLVKFFKKSFEKKYKQDFFIKKAQVKINLGKTKANVITIQKVNELNFNTFLDKKLKFYLNIYESLNKNKNFVSIDFKDLKTTQSQTFLSRITKLFNTTHFLASLGINTKKFDLNIFSKSKNKHINAVYDLSSFIATQKIKRPIKLQKVKNISFNIPNQFIENASFIDKNVNKTVGNKSHEKYTTKEQQDLNQQSKKLQKHKEKVLKKQDNENIELKIKKYEFEKEFEKRIQSILDEKIKKIEKQIAFKLKVKKFLNKIVFLFIKTSIAIFFVFSLFIFINIFCFSIIKKQTNSLLKNVAHAQFDKKIDLRFLANLSLKEFSILSKIPILSDKEFVTSMINIDVLYPTVYDLNKTGFEFKNKKQSLYKTLLSLEQKKDKNFYLNLYSLSTEFLDKNKKLLADLYQYEDFRNNGDLDTYLTSLEDIQKKYLFENFFIKWLSTHFDGRHYLSVVFIDKSYSSSVGGRPVGTLIYIIEDQKITSSFVQTSDQINKQIKGSVIVPDYFVDFFNKDSLKFEDIGIEPLEKSLNLTHWFLKQALAIDTDFIYFLDIYQMPEIFEDIYPLKISKKDGSILKISKKQDFLSFLQNKDTTLDEKLNAIKQILDFKLNEDKKNIQNMSYLTDFIYSSLEKEQALAFSKDEELYKYIKMFDFDNTVLRPVCISFQSCLRDFLYFELIGKKQDNKKPKLNINISFENENILHKIYFSNEFRDCKNGCLYRFYIPIEAEIKNIDFFNSEDDFVDKDDKQNKLVLKQEDDFKQIIFFTYKDTLNIKLSYLIKAKDKHTFSYLLKTERFNATDLLVDLSFDDLPKVFYNKLFTQESKNIKLQTLLKKNLFFGFSKN